MFRRFIPFDYFIARLKVLVFSATLIMAKKGV